MTEEEMQKHIKQMDDGKTIMAMAGKYNPTTFYAQPNQTIRVINHENKPISLISADGLFTVKELQAGKETQIISPAKAGTYKYSDPKNPGFTGTLVVENSK